MTTPESAPYDHALFERIDAKNAEESFANAMEDPEQFISKETVARYLATHLAALEDAAKIDQDKAEEQKHRLILMIDQLEEDIEKASKTKTKKALLKEANLVLDDVNSDGRNPSGCNLNFF